MSDVTLALINNLPAIIAAFGSLVTAVATAYIIVSQRGHKDMLEQIMEKQNVDGDHNHSL